jgi:hypothetical protein
MHLFFAGGLYARILGFSRRYIRVGSHAWHCAVKAGYNAAMLTKFDRCIGECVVRCHILDHEDQAMKTNANVVPEECQDKAWSIRRCTKSSSFASRLRIRRGGSRECNPT